MTAKVWVILPKFQALGIVSTVLFGVIHVVALCAAEFDQLPVFFLSSHGLVAPARADLFRAWALWTVSKAILHTFATSGSATLNYRLVEEDVITTVIPGDEAESLDLVEIANDPGALRQRSRIDVGGAFGSASGRETAPKISAIAVPL